MVFPGCNKLLREQNDDIIPKRYKLHITVFEKLIAHTQQSFHGVNSWKVERDCPPVFL